MKQVNTLLSNKFTHLPHSKSLVAEVSDFGRVMAMLPLYDDATDVGIALRNARTSNLTHWVFVNELKSPEGELIGWYLVPCNNSVHKNPAMAGYSMTILND
jgi:hypothetical protein